MSNRLGLVLDVETTGLRPTSDEIIELALILFTYDNETGEIIKHIDQESFLREPLGLQARMNYDQAYRIHGIPFSTVEGKSFHDEKIKSFIARADDIFAHNASFDRSFLYQMYPEVNDQKWFCTMRNVPWKQYGFENSKLLTLLQAHRITNFQTHRAMDDISYLMELMRKPSPAGHPYLKDVIAKNPMKKYAPASLKSRV
ncbi:exonuclease domain-containing protein [Peribacillus muralis]|uniref:exonuclease domain-containing protein n=1 Tax=Peribacillus muralis TaxID=264697 RepID=UPI001F4EB8C3|nr:exonuclease domain-containing protein [Peribacillus muralis]MCK1993298.1 exonuclease domain-containing protein [Peribacillus muralis]MCK2014414.1 exonuclease domain-containing protein [Peribacillus muralis]